MMALKNRQNNIMEQTIFDIPFKTGFHRLFLMSIVEMKMHELRSE